MKFNAVDENSKVIVSMYVSDASQAPKMLGVTGTLHHAKYNKLFGHNGWKIEMGINR